MHGNKLYSTNLINFEALAQFSYSKQQARAILIHVSFSESQVELVMANVSFDEWANVCYHIPNVVTVGKLFSVNSQFYKFFTSSESELLFWKSYTQRTLTLNPPPKKTTWKT